MSPQFRCGDYVVLVALFKRRFIRPGQRLVFDHPQYGRMVKEVVTVDTVHSTFEAKGLNSESVSMQQIGAMPFESVVGRVACSIKPSLNSSDSSQM